MPCFDLDSEDEYALPALNKPRPPKALELSCQQCREQSKQCSHGDRQYKTAAQAQAIQGYKAAAQARTTQNQGAASAAFVAAEAQAIRDQEAAAVAAAAAVKQAAVAEAAAAAAVVEETAVAAAAAAAAQARTKPAQKAGRSRAIQWQEIQLLGDTNDLSTVSTRMRVLSNLMSSEVCKQPFLQAAAAAAVNKLASGGHTCQQAIAYDPYIIDALVSLLHSRNTQVLNEAMAAVMTLASDKACPEAHAALCMPTFTPTLLALLHNVEFLMSVPGITSDVIYLVNFALRFSQALAGCGIQKFKAYKPLTDLLDSPRLRIPYYCQLVANCLSWIDYRAAIPPQGVLLCVDACTHALSCKDISTAHFHNVASGLHSMACQEYRDYDTAAQVVPQFLQKMMFLLRSNDQSIQAIALDAISCLAKNKFIDHAILSRSKAFTYLLPMMERDNEVWRLTAGKALHALLVAAGPDACDAVMECIHPTGWFQCLTGLHKMIGSRRPAEMIVVATQILTLLVEGSRKRQDRVLRHYGFVYRLVLLLHSTVQDVQVAGLEALCSLAAGNNNAVIMIKAQPGLDYDGTIRKMQCSGPGPLRRAACKAEHMIRTYYAPPEKSASWQEAVSKAFKTFTSYATCQQSLVAVRELSWTAYHATGTSVIYQTTKSYAHMALGDLC